MLFHTDLLMWYLDKGLIVSNITLAVRYQKKSPFKKFRDAVSDARRKGDKNKDYKLIGEMMKLLGNSSYGKCITNILNHETVKIVSEQNYDKNIRRNIYKTHEDLDDGYEFRFKKTLFKQNLPVQIGFAVYQLAKLRMLQFYYDFIDYYIDRSDFQYCGMDTDSAYISFTSENFDDMIRPELREHYQNHKHEWLGRNDSETNILFDRRTPGLFKLEYKGEGIISLASKMYYCFGQSDPKYSCKGINKKLNDITKQRYLNALKGNSQQEFNNTGFRVYGNKMSTYTLTKTGVKMFNDKRLRYKYDTLPTLL